jgi:predicted DNA-binding transcriptional regulator AlpA
MSKLDPATELMSPKEISEYGALPMSTAALLVRCRHFPPPVVTKGRMSLWAKKDVELFFVQHPRPEMRKAKTK